MSGMHARMLLLADQGIVIPPTWEAGPRVDDVLDPAAAARSASRVAGGSARSLPEPPELTAGRWVAIFYDGRAATKLPSELGNCDSRPPEGSER
jgi:hypothetical protein